MGLRHISPSFVCVSAAYFIVGVVEAEVLCEGCWE